jgi:O-antigen biosynthesis protein
VGVAPGRTARLSVPAFPQVDDPLVSAVMVTFGGWEWTERALAALRRHTDLPYEVIVVDNASPDGSGERLERSVRGATVIRNERNLGFGPANNHGAAAARGRYLALLNNDALVRPGWVAPLVEAAGVPGTGAVVPLLLNLDGTVQEAGSFVYADGSTEAYGAGAAHSELWCRFPRITDYGSAACVLIDRATFLDAGGFDPIFQPAYCEDVDLQLRLRERGLRTRFEPRSMVTHVRFAASGESRARDLIIRNRRILVDRWKEVLAGYVPPPGPDHPHRIVAARDREAVERILVLGPGRGDLAGALATRYPRGRVSWLQAVAETDGRAATMGAEVVAPQADVETWLRHRRFHYSAVVVDAGTFRDLRPLLDRLQPQATPIEGGDPDEVVRRLEGAGIMDDPGWPGISR